MTGFCAAAWADTQRLQDAMLTLPFTVALADGTLNRERFQFYLAQDSRYLVGFARALSVASTRATSTEAMAFFAESAHTALVVERELHAGYFERYGLSQADLDAIETSPTCLAYTNFLLATAQTAGYPELVAAVLPCFWVYLHVGRTILARQPESTVPNPYQAWIDTYADEDFAASVTHCKALVDSVASTVDDETRARMHAAFRRATEYEWLFWDSAWRTEQWPTRELRD